MVCYRDCYLAFAFILGTLFTMVNVDNCSGKKKLNEMLNSHQQEKIEEIIKERMTLYWHGTLLGIVIAIVMLTFNTVNNNVQRGCYFSLIILVVQYLFYMLSPKKDLMVTHLTSREQIKVWADVYRDMQWKYHLGLATGVIGYYFIGSGLLS
jgi:hypothetical protein